MKKFTVEGFIDFIRKQPADRPIDQLCWSTCAVGDYCIELGASVEQVGASRCVYGTLEVAGTLETIPAGDEDFAGFITGCSTYGEAQQGLDELGM